MKQSKISINIAKQTLTLYILKAESSLNIHQHNTKQPASTVDYQLQKEYSISTGKNGVGCQENTGKTPFGLHSIAEKIGASTPINSVFIGRVPTGEIYSTKLANANPNRDWILTRILRLTGEEQGINKGDNEQGCCDSYQRYIYIHGTPDSEPMGVAKSHGCIRMRNVDILDLFERVAIDTLVEIS